MTKKGLKKTDKNTKSVLDAPIPQNQSELRAFIGMVNFYSKFICNFAEKMEPLYKLLRKNEKFYFNVNAKKAYELLKVEITSEKVLAHFDPKKPIVLTTDACETAVARILSHKFPDGTLRPIAFVSRALSAAERNYATIQKEALAIVFSVTKLHQYLIGNEFILQTDHKPLLAIFGDKKGIPVMAAARMQRWAFQLSAFNFKIQHVKGSLNHADTLSRIPQSECNEAHADPTYINFIEFENHLQLNFRDIAIETRRDPILSKLLEAINKGLVKELKQNDFVPFHSRSDELTVESGCILWGYRTIVPAKLRKQILVDLHRSHMGIVKTKALARSYVWWPKIDNDIEQLVKGCNSCQLLQRSPNKSVLIPWKPTQAAWSRIHVDYAGPIKGFYILIIVDSYSKWVEAFLTKTITSSFTIKKIKRNIL